MPRDLANLGGGGQVMLKPDSEFVWLEVLRDPTAPQRAAVWGHGGRRWLIGFTTYAREKLCPCSVRSESASIVRCM